MPETGCGAVLGLMAIALVASIGCHGRPTTHEARVKILKVHVVAADADGRARSTDVEFAWADCPGTQRQAMRSGAAFSACVSKLKPGDLVPVKVIREWEEKGYYDWHVVEIAGCPAPPVDDDDSSFELVSECHDTLQMDAVVGFHCNRVAEGELIQQCPWFKR